MQHENGVPCHVNAWHTLQNHEGMRGGRGSASADIMHQDSLLPCLPALCVLVYSMQL